MDSTHEKEEHMKPGQFIRLACGSVLLSIALMSSWQGTAHAATLTVNTAVDENDHSCTVGGCSLREAVEVAASGDTIDFSLTYPATLALTNGPIVIDKNLTLSGPGASSLTISGSNASRVLNINAGVTVSISGVTISNANVAGVDEAPEYGGGIRNQGALTVNDCVLSNNRVRNVAFGAAIANLGTLTVNHTTFSGNHTEPFQGFGGSGGAIRNQGALEINDSLFSGNYCDGMGGAIQNLAALTVSRTTFSGNSAGVNGGAITNHVSATATVDASTFSNNHTDGQGGALTTYPQGSATVTNSTFSGNTASGTYPNGQGGAIDSACTLTLTNDTFWNNSASQYGGAIKNWSPLTLTNVTFFGNQASVSGGNISNSGTVTARNTILAGATAGGNCVGTIADGGGNLRWPSGDASCTGAFGDPKLGTLQDNGGPTWTMALGAESAASGIGVAANCPATDQRGQPRPNPPGSACDAGAYESDQRPRMTNIEEVHLSIRYNGWRGVQDTQASGGGYRVSKTANDKATYKFTGTSIKWVTRRGPDMGKAQVLIDGVNKGTFDLYSPTVAWQVAPKTFTGLKNKSHTIVVKVLGAKNIKASDKNVVVDRFIVGTATAEDDALAVQYNAWTGAMDTHASGGSYRSSKTNGASARLTFNGTSISWITARGPAYGKADVYIDGKKKGTYDLYQATPGWQTVMSFNGLSAGAHTIEVRTLGTKRAISKGTTVIVDAFQIQ